MDNVRPNFNDVQDGEKFRPPETPPHAKATIRQMLPMGLKESISKVRITSEVVFPQ